MSGYRKLEKFLWPIANISWNVRSCVDECP